ncbi:hypothetical protein Tco_0672486, partial [Tanacetum coccineum]
MSLNNDLRGHKDLHRINDVCTYDISASYGISHWWFNRQRFYIDRHTADSRRKVVRTHMRILNVVRIKTYSRYGYDYLKEIILRRADYQEYTIAEKDLKNLYPSDFEDLNLLLLQGYLNHLPGSDKRMLSTAKQLNLTKPRWDAKGFEYKHDYTIIESPHEVVFPVSNNERKIMRFNEIYKFSDGTLTNILEALDYRVKEYKVNRLNPGWSSQDLEVQVKIEMEIPRSSGVNFITACSYSTDTSKDLMIAQLSQAQDGERPQVDDQRLDLAGDLKEAHDHWKRISDKKTKNKAKNDKTEHGMEKCEKT